MSQPLLTVTDLACQYGEYRAVNGVSFTLEEGRIACLLGPSGCGKTTTLRAVAGLEPIQAGHIHIGGEEVARPGYQLAPERRRLGMVFQEHALFPHLTVAENVAFALRRESPAQRHERVTQCLRRVRLEGLDQRYPHELSGGQQQRVALARSLAPRPRLLLLDEPFASLDLDLRRALAEELGDILRQEQVAALMVTHDQEEAFLLADQVGVMRAGTLAQWDSPHRIYHAPSSRFVAEFAGYGTFLRGTVTATSAVNTVLGELRGGPLPWPAGTEVDVLLRPDDLLPDPQGTPLIVEKSLFTGPTILHRLRLPDGGTLLCQTSGRRPPARPGETLSVTMAPEQLVTFPLREDG
ncbi:ABC transporter ATP-binding protein [Alcanivorax xiamenensis]|uniref:ABC transporter ATP-binding protein n=1 Tax=Alcanivorax xiamenensis TaxID=1177156 RepID=A0ABQ6Y565_9GAMM|nr:MULTISPECIES: ABC transporter ATP-binding protein [Alcanivorax]KAF0804348.1 ABC transporter ATP-binding protein [Alcanivorax xiamenensis]